MQYTGRRLATISMLLLAGTALAQTSRADKPIESAHRAGPNGLEGWTESFPLADGQSVPANLVIAQRRHVIRRIEGDPFVWRWMFWENGKQVAYETGSLHFNMGARWSTSQVADNWRIWIAIVNSPKMPLYGRKPCRTPSNWQSHARWNCPGGPPLFQIACNRPS